MKERVRAHLLRRGDVVASGETVVGVSAGLYTPRGKVDVVLERDGKRFTATWGKFTEISITREEQKS